MRFLGWLLAGGVAYIMWDRSHRPRMVGKKAHGDRLIDQYLAMGEHVHRETTTGAYCEGGDYECPTFERQLLDLMPDEPEEEWD